jgi:hypothetical protein
MTKKTVFTCDLCNETQSEKESDFTKVKDGKIVVQAKTNLELKGKRISFEVKIGSPEESWEHVCLSCMIDLFEETMSKKMSDALLKSKKFN